MSRSRLLLYESLHMGHCPGATKRGTSRARAARICEAPGGISHLGAACAKRARSGALTPAASAKDQEPERTRTGRLVTPGAVRFQHHRPPAIPQGAQHSFGQAPALQGAPRRYPKERLECARLLVNTTYPSHGPCYRRGAARTDPLANRTVPGGAPAQPVVSNCLGKYLAAWRSTHAVAVHEVVQCGAADAQRFRSLDDIAAAAR